MNKVIGYETLYEEYINKEKPMWQIAQEQRCSIGSVYNYLKKYKIPTRIKMTQKTKEKISKSMLGKPSSRKGVKLSEETKRKLSLAKTGIYRVDTKYGGHKKKREDGYIIVYLPMHPYSNKDGYVMEHRLAMEKEIGRYILPNEVVHHKNHIRDDNRIENLEVMSFKDHAKLHMTERHQRGRLLSIK